jgi:hypothetical protein
MNMKKIELLGTRNLRHFHRERQSVIGRWKQRVIRNVDSMEMKIVLWQVQPNGLSITEKVNFMPAARQLRPERRRQDPTAANQRKTRDPNFERPRFHHPSV